MGAYNGRSDVKVDGYIRVSRVAGRGGDGFISPDVQRERIAAYADAIGHDVLLFHEDLDQPGGRYARPGFQEALARVEQGETDGIIVASLDRFARSVPDAAVALRRLEDAGGTLISVKDALDTSTPVGKFARTMMLALAELELDRIRENWNTAQAHAVGRGIHIASRTPTGYVKRDDRRLTPDPEVSPVIRELFRRRADGSGWGELAAYLDSKRVVSPYGNSSWTARGVQQITQNRVYLGEARSGRHVNAEAHEPIVTRVEWEAAQAKRSAPTPRKGDGLLLSGLVRCASCRYVVKPDTMKDRDGSRLGFYRCRGRHASGKCPAPVGVLARVLDPHIESQFLEAISNEGQLAERLSDNGDVDELVTALELAEQELAAYRDGKLVSVIGRQAFQAGLETRAQRVDEARRALADATTRSGLSDAVDITSIAEEWPSLSVAERRRILTASIDAVFIRPTRGSGRQVSIAERALLLWAGTAPPDLPRRGRRVPLESFVWPDDAPAGARVAVGEHT